MVKKNAITQLDTVRHVFKDSPKWRNRVFGAAVAVGVFHGAYLMCANHWGFFFVLAF